jgi:hypothetical protein
LDGHPPYSSICENQPTIIIDIINFKYSVDIPYWVSFFALFLLNGNCNIDTGKSAYKGKDKMNKTPKQDSHPLPKRRCA